MKNLAPLSLLALLTSASCVDGLAEPHLGDGPEAAPLAAPDAPTPGPINRVVGDLSWQEARPGEPLDDASDVERIRAHLGWVEAELRAKDVSLLPFELRFARARNLDRLRAYAEAGRFPRNEPGDPRLPRFAEEAEGEDEPRICAVGWLYAADAGEDAALRVNEGFEHEHVEDIDDPDLLAWALSSGLTLEELAMIQPGYDHMRPPPVDPVKAVQARLAGLEPQINRCVHDRRKPRDKHPEKIAATIEIGRDGTLGQASFDLDTSPDRLDLERCFVGALQTVARVGPVAGGVKIKQAWAIVGPTKKDGTFDTRYLPVLTRGVEPAVKACAARYLHRQHLALRVVLDGRLLPKGVARADGLAASPAAESNASFEVCARGALTGLDVPVFKGDEVPVSVAVAIPAGAPPLQMAK